MENRLATTDKHDTPLDTDNASEYPGFARTATFHIEVKHLDGSIERANADSADTAVSMCRDAARISGEPAFGYYMTPPHQGQLAFIALPEFYQMMRTKTRYRMTYRAGGGVGLKPLHKIRALPTPPEHIHWVRLGKPIKQLPIAMTGSRLPELPEPIVNLPTLCPSCSDERLLGEGYLLEYQSPVGYHVEEIFSTVRLAATRALTVHSETHEQVWGSRQFKRCYAMPSLDAKPVLEPGCASYGPHRWRVPLFTTCGEHMDEGLQIQLWSGDIYDTHYHKPPTPQVQALDHKGPRAKPWWDAWATRIEDRMRVYEGDIDSWLEGFGP